MFRNKVCVKKILYVPTAARKEGKQLKSSTNCPLTAQMYRKTDIQPVNKRQKTVNSEYIKALMKIIRFLKIFFANLHFRVRGQKGYCAFW